MSILDKVKGAGYSRENTKNETLELTRKVFRDKIKGDFVECGIAQGVQIAIMASVNQQQNNQRKIYGYDSFEGIPFATKKDTQQPGSNEFKPKKPGDHLMSSGISIHSLDEVTRTLSIWGLHLEQFKFMEGWFEETVPRHNIGKICLLRLDGDLYESTKVCLEHLYPKLVKGGILIIDDWVLKGCRLACDEYFGDYKGLKPLKDINLNEPMNFIKL